MKLITFLMLLAVVGFVVGPDGVNRAQECGGVDSSEDSLVAWSL